MIVLDIVSESTLSEKINNWFEPIVNQLGEIVFWDPIKALGFDIGASVPLIVLWLIFGAIYFTVRFKFINLWGVKHSIQVISGKYDDPDDKGDVSHFQALTTALSATVGLGNIASVAIAISIGGPGATLWMIVAGILGMATKFVECTLGVKYREIDKDGNISGGPMYYLKSGLVSRGFPKLGKFMAITFSILVVLASLGGGSMFQANQSFQNFALMSPEIAEYGFWYGIILSVLVAAVIVGGIKSIANVTDKIVPIMAFVYVGAALFIIFMNIDRTSEAISLIWNGAFSPGALKGGVIGVIIIGFKRAGFSNEAGIGSAAIAHSAVKTKHPISEGFVALIEPFIDTVVICTMTALVIIFTGYSGGDNSLEGSQLTSAAFGSVLSWFPYLLTAAIFLFAFSTMISWSYYGVKGFDYLFGDFCAKHFKSRKVSNQVYNILLFTCIVIGSSSSLGAVMDFSDMMILAMAFPNMVGLYMFTPEILRDLKSYRARLKSGEIKKYK